MKTIEVGGFKLSKYQKHLVNEVLNSERLSYGQMTEEFEAKWAALHGVKYALFCNSGTSALQVAIHALKEKYLWTNDDEVIIPALTFVATMNVVLHNNLKPVLVDIEKKYFNIDPAKIEEKITARTKAIIAVHLLGQPAQMDKIMKIARKHNLKVIEDSCETVGALYDGKPVGSWGDVGCFSTYASHLIVTGVGGFACTNDDDLAIRIKGLYNHGRDGVYNKIDDDDKNSIEMIESRFNFVYSGYSYRLTEMESAIGVGHLKRFSKEFKKRNQNASYLVDELGDLEDLGLLSLPKIHPKVSHSFMLFPVVVNPEKIDRDHFIKWLEYKGIMTRFMMPLLRQPIVKAYFGDVMDLYPVAKYMDTNAFLIGVHPELSQKDLQYIVNKFHEYVRCLA